MRRGSLLAALALGGGMAAVAAQQLPLHTESRWIMDSTGTRVKLRCINWMGHGEVNIPEGLSKQPVAAIAGFIADHGFNCVRLTYSIDHALSPTVSVQDSFALAANASGVAVDVLDGMYAGVVAQNPGIANGTQQDAFAAVIKALWDRQVMTILDNHVSKAQWCCDLDDGNGWWDQAAIYVEANSQYFKTDEWLDGLTAMATWATGQPGVAAMSLRNELRPFPLLQDTDGHAAWYTFVAQGGQRVHAANPDVLVVVGGSQSATDLSFVRTAGNINFAAAWAADAKLVWEMHAYSFTVTFPRLFDSCDVVQAEYGAFDGFLLEQDQVFTAPLFVSEFGVGQTGGPNNGGLSDTDQAYYDCLSAWMEGNDADWALWAVQGSYYVREGVADYDETWGLLNHDWTALRNDQFLPLMAPLFLVTQGP